MTHLQQFSIKQAVSQAKKAAKKGDPLTAIELYQAVLKHHPSHISAKKELKKLQKKLLANQSLNTPIKNPPQDQINNLIKIYQSGELSQAEHISKQLLHQHPQTLVLFNILGASLQRQGKLQEALDVFNKTITLKPDYADAYNNKGVVYRGLGKTESAIKNYKKAISLKPDYADAHYNLGTAYSDLGHQEQAIKSYEKAIQCKPDHAQAYHNQGVIFGDLGQLEKAIENYGKAIEIKPDYIEAYNNRGSALKDLDRFEEAINDYEKAIAYKTDFATAHYNRGNALRDMGQIQEAAKSYEKAIDCSQDFSKAHHNLSYLKKYRPGDNQIALMEQAYQGTALEDSDRTHLCFALAKVYEDLSDYPKSFHFLSQGNNLRKQALNYHIQMDQNLLTLMKGMFNQLTDVITNRPSPIKPVFILGMPRSGTSLVEQILASHTTVYGAGELTTMGHIAASILPDMSCWTTAQGIPALSSNNINTVYNHYLGYLTDLQVPEKIITDKTPLNFWWIGFILSAFPEAKIIHLNRDPMATCWSVYKHYFRVDGHGYAYDLEDLAKFYKLYIEMMKFWRQRFPGSIYDLCYEELTINQEQETRKLLAFCELEWEDQCLEFHKTQRVVKTASAAQVRKKMYKGSSEAWKKYESQLQPLRMALSC